MLSTLAEIKQDVKLRLGEASNSVAGALASGSGANTYDRTTNDTIMQLANEAIADLCRRGGVAIPAIATASMAASAVTVPFGSLTVSAPTGARVWAIRPGFLTLAGADTQIISGGLAQIYSMGSTNPQYAYREGAEMLSFTKPMTGTTALSCRVLVIPADLSLDTDTITPYIESDQRKLISFYCAAMIAQKNIEDATMANRIQPWMQMYEAGRQSILERLLREDPALYAAHYAGLVPQSK